MKLDLVVAIISCIATIIGTVFTALSYLKNKKRKK